MANSIEREQLPFAPVFIQDAAGELASASDDLSGAVHQDLVATRERILDAFGGTTVGLDEELQGEGDDFFRGKGWSVPKSVVIDPQQDTARLQQIFEDARLRSPRDEAFFAGTGGGALVSPGCAPPYDLIILHDWRERFRADIQGTARHWNYTIDDSELDAAVEQSLAELIAHERSHLAGVGASCKPR